MAKKARKQPAPLPLMLPKLQLTTPIQKPDNVNHPSHYQGKRECIEVMRKMFGDEAVKGFCKCNAYKYRFRAGRKGSAEEYGYELTVQAPTPKHPSMITALRAFLRDLED